MKPPVVDVSFRVSSLWATRIAGVDRQRVNEAFADGHFRTWPSGDDGSRRRFTEAEIIALVVFGRLTGNRVPSSVAGPYACIVALRAHDPKLQSLQIELHVTGGLRLRE